MHTRGRQANGGGLVRVCGTTHAHAGQTLIQHRVVTEYRNHPCTRGADAC